METLSFAFGILTMFAVMLVVAVVVGIVKVYKQSKQITNLENALGHVDQNLCRNIDDVAMSIHRTMEESDRSCAHSFDELHRRIDEVEKYLRQEINDRSHHLDTRIDEMGDATRVTSQAYTDARIDKLEAKLTGKSEKQLLKN